MLSYAFDLTYPGPLYINDASFPFLSSCFLPRVLILPESYLFIHSFIFSPTVITSVHHGFNHKASRSAER